MDRVLDAAERLFAARGFEGVSVAEIGREAGVSVGSFYARFRDKAALLDRLQERVIARVLATWEEAVAPDRWRDADLPRVVDGIVGTFARVAGEHADLIRVFFWQALRDPALRRRGTQLPEGLVRPLLPLLLAHRDAIRHPNPPLAIMWGFRLVFAMTQHLILSAEPPESAPAVLVRAAPELSHAYLAYLTVKPRTPEV